MRESQCAIYRKSDVEASVKVQIRTERIVYRYFTSRVSKSTVGWHSGKSSYSRRRCHADRQIYCVLLG